MRKGCMRQGCMRQGCMRQGCMHQEKVLPQPGCPAGRTLPPPQCAGHPRQLSLFASFAPPAVEEKILTLPDARQMLYAGEHVKFVPPAVEDHIGTS